MEATLATHPDGIRPMNAGEAVEQMTKATILAVSGGRLRSMRADRLGWDGDSRPLVLSLPCQYGYRVDVFLHASDTYIVRRVFRRGAREWVKGEARDVYAGELSETVYRAGMFRDPWPRGGA